MAQYKNPNAYTVKNCASNCSSNCNYPPQPDCNCKPQPDHNCKPQPSNCGKYSEMACEKCKQAAIINQKASEMAKNAKEAEQRAEYYKQLFAEECEKATKFWEKHYECCEESIALIKEAKQLLIREEQCFEDSCSKDCPSNVCDCVDECIHPCPPKNNKPNSYFGGNSYNDFDCNC